MRRVVHDCCQYAPTNKRHTGNSCFVHQLLNDAQRISHEQRDLPLPDEQLYKDDNFRLRLFTLLQKTPATLIVKTIQLTE